MSQITPPNLDPVRDLYDRSLKEHGASAKGVGWGDEKAHLLRFEKLAGLIEQPGPVSVSDLGCGYGAFLEYLVARGAALKRFRGYDISEKMLQRAMASHPGSEWVQASKLDDTTDYAFACGIFNVRMAESEPAWQAFIEATLEDLDRHSTGGFAFNLLSTYVDYRAPNLYYGDPGYFFDLCKRRFSRKVTLLHDYPLYEWTILVRK